MAKRKLSDITIGGRIRKDMKDVPRLAASMQAVGLLQPVVIRPDNSLVAGARRLEAARSLGWSEVDVHVAVGLEDECRLLAAQNDENDCREDFTPTEKVAMGQAIEKAAKGEAKRRQREGGKQGAASTNRKLGRKADPA